MFVCSAFRYMGKTILCRHKQLVNEWNHISCRFKLQLADIAIDCSHCSSVTQNDVIKWKHFPRYRSPVNSPHKGKGRALIFSLICARINDWGNTREAGDLRRHRAHYDVTVMTDDILSKWCDSFWPLFTFQKQEIALMWEYHFCVYHQIEKCHMLLFERICDIDIYIIQT